MSTGQGHPQRHLRAKRILQETKETDQTIKQIKLAAGAGPWRKELEEQRSGCVTSKKRTMGKLVKSPGPKPAISPKKLKIGDGVKVPNMNLRARWHLPNSENDSASQMNPPLLGRHQGPGLLGSKKR